MHLRRISSPGHLANLQAHVTRAYAGVENAVTRGEIDAEYTHLNEHFIYTDASNTLKKRDEIIENAKKENEKKGHKWRKPNKNAALAVEGIYSFSNIGDGWKTNEKLKNTIRNYFNETLKFAQEKYGKENIISAAVHYDETTPHMHILFAPIVKSQDGKNKYSSHEFMGGFKDLRETHTEYYEKVGKKFGLERGEVGNRQQHTTLKEHSRNLKKREADLERKTKEIQKYLASKDSYEKIPYHYSLFDKKQKRDLKNQGYDEAAYSKYRDDKFREAIDSLSAKLYDAERKRDANAKKARDYDAIRAERDKLGWRNIDLAKKSKRLETEYSAALKVLDKHGLLAEFKRLVKSLDLSR